MKFGFDLRSGFREEENNGHIRVYRVGAGTDNTLG